MREETGEADSGRLRILHPVLPAITHKNRRIPVDMDLTLLAQPYILLPQAEHEVAGNSCERRDKERPEREACIPAKEVYAHIPLSGPISCNDDKPAALKRVRNPSHALYTHCPYAHYIEHRSGIQRRKQLAELLCAIEIDNAEDWNLMSEIAVHNTRRERSELLCRSKMGDNGNRPLPFLEILIELGDIIIGEDEITLIDASDPALSLLNNRYSE